MFVVSIHTTCSCSKLPDMSEIKNQKAYFLWHFLKNHLRRLIIFFLLLFFLIMRRFLDGSACFCCLRAILFWFSLRLISLQTSLFLILYLHLYNEIFFRLTNLVIFVIYEITDRLWKRNGNHSSQTEKWRENNTNYCQEISQQKILQLLASSTFYFSSRRKSHVVLLHMVNHTRD